MEIVIKVINNKYFTKYYLKIRELITASMNIYQAKKEKKSIPIVMKTCFSEKLIKQFGNLTFN